MKTGKRLISLLLLLAMVFTIIPSNAFARGPVSDSVAQLATENQTELPFADVNEGDWYYDAVKYAYKNGIFNGTSATSFEPSGGMSRAMFVTAMGRFAGINPDKYSGADTGFKDVVADAYYAPYVAWAAEKKITGGVGNQYFDTDGLITREQMAVFTHRFFEAYAVSYQSDTKTPPADLDQAASWARESIQALWNAGIFNGDGNGRFNPQRLATRAEAATFLQNTDKNTDAKGIDSDGKTPPVSGDGAYTVTFESNGGTAIAPMQVPKGTALKKLPVPSKTGFLHIGWYLENTFTTQFFENDIVDRDLTLYARYTTLAIGENEVDTYSGSHRTAEENEVDPNYIIHVSAPNKTSDFVMQNIRLDSNSDEGSLNLSKTGDTYDLSMDGGFKAGTSYTLVLLDDALTFTGKDERIRELSFRIFKEQIDELYLNHEMQYIKLNQLSNITLNGTSITPSTAPSATSASTSSLSQAIFEYANNLSGGEGSSKPTGTFEYGGALSEGDLVCLYSRIKPTEGTDEDLAYDDISYVKIVSGNNNVYTFEVAEPSEILELPKTAAISKEEITLTQSPESKTAGQPFAFTANTISFDTIAVGGSAFIKNEIKKGDVIVIYEGSNILQASEEDSILGTVESIHANDGLYTVTAKTTTMEELKRNVPDYYQTTPVDMQEMAAHGMIDLDVITNDIAAQIANDEVVEKLAHSYAEMVLAGDVLDEFSDGAPVGVQMEDGSFADLTALGAAGGGNSVDFKLDAPDYSPRIRPGEAYGERSNQLEFQVKFTITFKVKDAEEGTPAQTVKVQFTIDFTQELQVCINASANIAWGTRYFIIPYVKYCRADADLDIKTRTEVNFKALLKTSDGYTTIDVDISEDIKNLIGLGNEDEREIVEEVALIYKRYQELVKAEMSFIRIFERELYSANIPIIKFILYIELEVNVFEEIAATAALYADIEFKEGTRHSFSADLVGETITYQKSQLFEDSLGFNVDLMGRLRWRAGIEASVSLVVISDALASMSLSIAGGPYFDWFGFFNYKYQRTGDTITDSRMGAMYMEAGFFLEAGAQIKSLSKYQVNVGFIDEEWPIWSSHSKDYVYDFSYALKEGESFTINKTQNSLPDYALKMIQLDLEDGKSHLLTYDPSRFDIVFSNSAFSLKNGKIEVDTEDILAVSDMTIIWKGGPLAFTSFPIKRTFRVIYNESGTPTPMGVLSVTVNGELIWSERAALDTEYQSVLPSKEEILELIGYKRYNRTVNGNEQNLRYSGTGDYADSLDGTLTESKNFEYTIPVREYSVTVSGVQAADGSTRDETITAPYGGKFDFSSLSSTGTSIKNTTYTQFKNVETMGEEGLSLHDTLQTDLALQILNGTHTYQATYVDNSNTVQYVFFTLEGSIGSVSRIIERNTAPDFDYLAYMKETKVDQDDEQGYSLFQLDGDVTSPVTNDRTIYITAVPSAGYDLFYIKNGGTWAESYTAPTQYTPVESADDPDATTLPAYGEIVRKDGYEFAGWYDNSDFSGNPVTTVVGNQGPMTYYALWVAPKYTIRFVGAGGTGEMTDMENLTFGAEVILKANVFEYESYKARDYSNESPFLGWNTKVDGTGIDYDDAASFNIPTGISPDGVLTLYAQWDDYKVTYEPNNSNAPVSRGEMALNTALTYCKNFPGTITMLEQINAEESGFLRPIELPDGTIFSGQGKLDESDMYMSSRNFEKADTIFVIPENAAVKIENIYIHQGSGVIENQGTLTIENSKISAISNDYSKTLPYSPIIINAGGGKVIIRNTEFYGNGSAILSNKGTMLLDNCSIQRQTADTPYYRNGIIINEGTMLFNNVNYFNNGNSSYYNSYLYNKGGDLYILNTSIIYNRSGSDGAACLKIEGGSVSIVNSVIGANVNVSSGENKDHNITITDQVTSASLDHSIYGEIRVPIAEMMDIKNSKPVSDDDIYTAVHGMRLNDPALRDLAATVHLDYSNLDNIKIGFSYNGAFTSILGGATEDTPVVDKYYGGAERNLSDNRIGAKYLEIQQD